MVTSAWRTSPSSMRINSRSPVPSHRHTRPITSRLPSYFRLLGSLQNLISTRKTAPKQRRLPLARLFHLAAFSREPPSERIAAPLTGRLSICSERLASLLALAGLGHRRERTDPQATPARDAFNVLPGEKATRATNRPRWPGFRPITKQPGSLRKPPPDQRNRPRKSPTWPGGPDGHHGHLERPPNAGSGDWQPDPTP